MAIDKVGGVSGAGVSPSLETGKDFGRVLEGVKGPGRPGPRVATEGAPSVSAERASPERVEASRGTCRADGTGRAEAGQLEVRPGGRVDSVQSARAQQAVQVLDRVGEAQKRLDHILKLAESGKTFTPAELLAFQAHVYRASQELDMAGKVVEKATGGVKQVLQTQV